MSQPTARLVVQRGPNLNQVYELALDKITIGRSPANEISITDPEISRKHAQLIRQESGYALEDLGSTNGSFVNDRRVVGLTPLHNGDVIELGEAISLVYQAVSPETDATRVTAGPSLAELDTIPEGLAAPSFTPPAYEAPLRPSAPPAESTEPAETWGMSCGQRILIGCGALVLVLFLCTATLYFLDAYDQGRLLYCGALRPFWEFLLGPFGFAPLCA
ncbi:MAG: FHA domain-containing protein [Ardenticatenaceae bacterium]|nr:FHA domain-containing protein [Ardenticatenaceae bacterium]MCB8986452.1 FHA domain-containing protein [Ardenticatenaceae bacterium]